MSYAIGLFGVYLPLAAPHIVNMLHQWCHLLWFLYISWCLAGQVVWYFLMFGFVPLTEIFIIVAVVIQHWRLFFLPVRSYSCSPDDVSFVLGCLDSYASGIFPHSCDYDSHLCGSDIGSGIIDLPHSCGFCGFYLICVHLNIGRKLSIISVSSFSASLILLFMSLA